MNKSPDIDAVFKALADPTRRKIVEVLSTSDPLTVNRIAGMFNMTRQGVTKHLTVLEEAGVLKTTFRGRERLNEINPESLELLVDWTNYHHRFWRSRLAVLKEQIEARRGKKPR